MKTVFLILISCFSISCSRLEVAYNFADNYMTSKADDYLDLSSKQKKELKARLQKDLDRTRTEIFPEVAKQLQVLQSQIDQPWTAEVVAEDVQIIKDLFLKFLGYFKVTTLETLLAASPEQFATFDQEASEALEDSRDVEEFKEKIAKRYRRNVEMWIGGISKDQRGLLDKLLMDHPYPIQLQVQNKEHLLSQFQKARKNPQELELFIDQYFKNQDSLKLPAYVTALSNHHQAVIEFAWKEFSPTVTSEQKKNLHRNLQARIDQLLKLAEKKN